MLSPGVDPEAWMELPAVLVVAQGMEIQSVVQVVSPNITTPSEVGLEMEKLSEIVCKGLDRRCSLFHKTLSHV